MANVVPHVQAADDEVVVGVDTHKDFHVAVAINAVGAVIDGRRFTATADGYRRLISWSQSLGSVRQAGVEGTGSYGAGLTKALRAAGIEVAEVNRPDRSARRRRGKTDLVDAEAAARAVLSGQAAVCPKTADGAAESMRVLKIAKDSAVKARVQAVNQLKAVLVNADAPLRDQLSPLRTGPLIKHCTLLNPRSWTGVTATVVSTLGTLARRIQYLDAEIGDLKKQIQAAVKQAAPQLLELPGIGPDSAATLLITAGDNPHRLRSEASFAALCGVSPVEASSGKTRRHRLSRGGQRQANAALFRAVTTNLRWDARTRAYMSRRTTEGRSKLETIRCLKRYLARSAYHAIRAAIPAPA